MTQQEKENKAELSAALVRVSIQRLTAGEKDKDDHIQVLEATVARLVWLCKQPIEAPAE